MRKRKENYLNIKVKYKLLELYASLYKSIRIYIRYPVWIISDFITTPLWIITLLIPLLLFLPYKEWKNPITYQYFYWGMIGWSIISTSLWGFGMSLRREQQMGTLEYLYITNTNRIILQIGDTLRRLLMSIIELVYMAVIIQALFNTPIYINNPIMVLISFLGSYLICMGFGILYGAITLEIKNPGPLINILQFILLGLSGAFYSVMKLPPIIQLIALIIPFTYSFDIIRYYAFNELSLIHI